MALGFTARKEERSPVLYELKDLRTLDGRVDLSGATLSPEKVARAFEPPQAMAAAARDGGAAVAEAPVTTTTARAARVQAVVPDGNRVPTHRQSVSDAEMEIYAGEVATQLAGRIATTPTTNGQFGQIATVIKTGILQLAPTDQSLLMTEPGLQEAIGRITLHNPDRFAAHLITTIAPQGQVPDLMKLIVVMSRLYRIGAIDRIELNGIREADIQQLLEKLKTVSMKELPNFHTPEQRMKLVDFIKGIQEGLSAGLFTDAVNTKLETYRQDLETKLMTSVGL